MCMAASMRCPALCSLACRRRCDSLTSSSTSAPAASSHSQAPVVRESRQRHCVRKAGRDRHLVPIPLWALQIREGALAKTASLSG